MEEIVGASVDLLFCNDEEAMIFTGTNKVSEAREKLKQVAKRFVITLGANGAVIFDGDTFINIEPYKVQAVDTNGAGDMFSGSFLYVTQFGPRLETQQVKRVLKELSNH